jgi:hypothetical protein
VNATGSNHFGNEGEDTKKIRQKKKKEKKTNQKKKKGRITPHSHIALI